MNVLVLAKAREEIILLHTGFNQSLKHRALQAKPRTIGVFRRIEASLQCIHDIVVPETVVSRNRLPSNFKNSKLKPAPVQQQGAELLIEPSAFFGAKRTRVSIRAPSFLMQLEKCRKALKQIILIGTPVDAKIRPLFKPAETVFKVFTHRARELLEISIPMIGQANLTARCLNACMDPPALDERCDELACRW